MAILSPLNAAELVRTAQRLAVATARRVRPDYRTITARSVTFSADDDAVRPARTGRAQSVRAAAVRRRSWPSANA